MSQRNGTKWLSMSLEVGKIENGKKGWKKRKRFMIKIGAKEKTRLFIFLKFSYKNFSSFLFILYHRHHPYVKIFIHYIDYLSYLYILS